jgi:hypothetical protein
MGLHKINLQELLPPRVGVRRKGLEEAHLVPTPIRKSCLKVKNERTASYDSTYHT